MKQLTVLSQRVLGAVDKRAEMLDKIVAILLALCPLLQHYRGIGLNAAQTVMILLIPYLFLRALSRIKDFRFAALRFVYVLILFLVFRVVNHGTSFDELGHSGVLIIYMLAIAFGCINVRFFCAAAAGISLAASCVLLLQYLCYYLFGFHLQVVITQLLLPESKQWILMAQTGTIGITGKVGSLYRPSAFFLEPSHLYLYCFPFLLLTLFSGSKRKYALVYPILISAGMILCTSGMGIAVVAMAWGLFCVTADWKERTFRLSNILKKRNLLLIGSLIVLFVAAYFLVPFVRTSVNRIFYSDSGSTAVSGRTQRAILLIKKMPWYNWFAGMSDTIGVKFNVPGFFATFYRHGMFGILLSYWIYVRGIFKRKLSYSLVAIVIVVTSFFSAHTHGTCYMLFYVLILLDGETEDAASLTDVVDCYTHRVYGIAKKALCKIRKSK